MTDDEKAEEYYYKTYPVTLNIGEEERKKEVTDIFLAGLKAGRPQWHDINDTEPSEEQLGKQLLIRMKSVIGDIDYDYLVYKYSGESITDVPDVIAWCEIPTFDKE